MIPKKFNEITFDDIQLLIEDGVSEGRTLDYKRDLPGNGDGEKKKFLSDIASFANASGGDLIFGLAEKRDGNDKNTGTPEMFGLDANINVDQEIQRLQNMILNGIAPKIPPVQIRFLKNAAEKYVGVLRVMKSWFPPHMVTFNASPSFFSRNSAGKHPLDVTEIRNAFLGGEHLAQKIEGFRNERIGRIMVDEVPLKLMGPHQVIIHFVPYESIEGERNLSLNRQVALRPPFQSGFSARLNLNGVLVTGNTTDGRTMSYVQAYRDGKLEFVDCGTLSNLSERHAIPHVTLEKSIIETMNQAISFYKSQDIASPVVVMISLLNVAGGKIFIDSFERTGDPIQEQHLFLPDFILEPQWETPISKLLQPVFDLIWNACGYEKCGNYDSTGNWNPPRR